MSRLFNKMDKTLLILSIIMFVFGLFMILDASSMRSFIDYGTNNRFFFKQLIILIISFLHLYLLYSFLQKNIKNGLFLDIYL